MNRTIKDATVKRHQDDDHAQLERHLADFIVAYNFGQWLKILTPDKFICECYTSEPYSFRPNPSHDSPGLNVERTLPMITCERPSTDTR